MVSQVSRAVSQVPKNIIRVMKLIVFMERAHLMVRYLPIHIPNRNVIPTYIG